MSTCLRLTIYLKGMRFFSIAWNILRLIWFSTNSLPVFFSSFALFWKYKFTEFNQFCVQKCCVQIFQARFLNFCFSHKKSVLGMGKYSPLFQRIFLMNFYLFYLIINQCPMFTIFRSLSFLLSIFFLELSTFAYYLITFKNLFLWNYVWAD